MEKVILLIATTFISKIIAYGKELALAYFYGAADISDIYFMALAIPSVIFGFFSNGISSGFVPAYKRAVGDKANIKDGNKFTNEIIAILIFASLGFVLLYFPFNHAIFDLFAKGFNDIEKGTTIVFSNIMVFSIVFSCITAVMRSFIQANEKTAVIGLLSIPLNIVLVISIVLSSLYKNVFFLPYGYLSGCFTQAVIFVIIAKQYGYAISRKISLWNKNIRYFLSSIFILTIGSSVSQINVLVDKILASTVTVGGVASLEFGHRIIDLISGLFIISISTVQFPRFVNNNNDKERISACFREGIENLIVFLIPLSFVLILFSREIITLVYARGAFGNEAIESTSPVLVFYGIGLIAIGIRELVSKLYYALGDMRTPVINAVIGVILNIILNFVLVDVWGIGGLAFATSISSIVVSIILLFQIRRKIILQFSTVFYMKLLLLSVLSSVLCEIVITCINSDYYHMNILIGFMAFVFVYLIGANCFGVFDIKTIRTMIKRPL